MTGPVRRAQPAMCSATPAPSSAEATQARRGFVGHHGGEPVQRRHQRRCGPGERRCGSEQHHLVRDLGQPAGHPCLGGRAGVRPAHVDRGGVEEERARPQPGDHVQRRRAHECLPVPGQLAAQRDEPGAGGVGAALGEQLHHRHGVGDDRSGEVVEQRPGELVGRGTGVEGDGVAGRSPARPRGARPAGARLGPGTCPTCRDRGSPTARPTPPCTVRTWPVVSSRCRSRRTVMCETPSSRARSATERTPTSRRRASTQARRCAPASVPARKSVMRPPPAPVRCSPARSAPPGAPPARSGPAPRAGRPRAGRRRPRPRPPWAGGRSSGAG